MKIIKEGRDMTVIFNRVIICDKCGCEFMPDGPKDIITQDQPCQEYRVYSICPNKTCKNAIDIEPCTM